jgi:hypothetical protein
MTPTLREFDLLEIQPYGDRKVQIGDVVAFQPSGGTKHVVHRVIHVGQDGIRTLGDNNLYEDAVDLTPEDLTGRVVAAWRGQWRRKVYGGSVGRLIAYAVRITRKLDRSMSWILRPAYHALARSGALRQILPPGWRPRLVGYQVDGRIRYHLLLGGRLVGRYDRDLGAWQIRRPFKLLVDERSLPVPEKGPTDAGRMVTALQQLPAEH